jgi:hypothetical protein
MGAGPSNEPPEAGRLIGAMAREGAMTWIGIR